MPLCRMPNADLFLRHYSYECKAVAQERPYVSRPSRTQMLLNPKLVPKLTSDVPNDLLRKFVLIPSRSYLESFFAPTKLLSVPILSLSLSAILPSPVHDAGGSVGLSTVKRCTRRGFLNYAWFRLTSFQLLQLRFHSFFVSPN